MLLAVKRERLILPVLGFGFRFLKTKGRSQVNDRRQHSIIIEFLAKFFFIEDTTAGFMLEWGHRYLYLAISILVPAISQENLLRYLNKELLK